MSSTSSSEAPDNIGSIPDESPNTTPLIGSPNSPGDGLVNPQDPQFSKSLSDDDSAHDRKIQELTAALQTVLTQEKDRLDVFESRGNLLSELCLAKDPDVKRLGRDLRYDSAALKLLRDKLKNARRDAQLREASTEDQFWDAQVDTEKLRTLYRGALVAESKRVWEYQAIVEKVRFESEQRKFQDKKEIARLKEKNDKLCAEIDVFESKAASQTGIKAPLSSRKKSPMARNEQTKVTREAKPPRRPAYDPNVPAGIPCWARGKFLHQGKDITVSMTCAICF